MLRHLRHDRILIPKLPLHAEPSSGMFGWHRFIVNVFRSCNLLGIVAGSLGVVGCDLSGANTLYFHSLFDKLHDFAQWEWLCGAYNLNGGRSLYKG